MENTTSTQNNPGDKVTYTPSANNNQPAKAAWWIPVLAVLGIIGVIFLLLAAPYNGLVSKRENVRTSRSDLQAQYQRRADLVPNLVATVKGAGANEQNIFTQVVEARAKATSVNINVDNLSSEQMQNFQNAQAGLSTSLGRLIALAEQYPTVNSTQNFKDLQNQLEGIENRIATARRDYNNAVNPYNKALQTFPTNITARIFGFVSEPYFEADAGASTAPTVNFDSSTSVTSTSSAQ